MFGNGLSALLTLMGISAAVVALFVVGPLLVGGERPRQGWGRWLAYFGALGAGFMLLEIALLQRLVLLLGHPVYSLTVTLFSLLLGTGLGSLGSRRMVADRVKAAALCALAAVFALALVGAIALSSLVNVAISSPLSLRIGVSVTLLIPTGILLGIPLPAGMRLLAATRPVIIPWGWGMNGAFSVVGATAAVFFSMNWGFSATLSIGALVYAFAAATLGGVQTGRPTP